MCIRDRVLRHLCRDSQGLINEVHIAWLLFNEFLKHIERCFSWLFNWTKWELMMGTIICQAWYAWLVIMGSRRLIQIVKLIIQKMINKWIVELIVQNLLESRCTVVYAWRSKRGLLLWLVGSLIYFKIHFKMIIWRRMIVFKALNVHFIAQQKIND